MRHGARALARALYPLAAAAPAGAACWPAAAALAAAAPAPPPPAGPAWPPRRRASSSAAPPHGAARAILAALHGAEFQPVLEELRRERAAVSHAELVAEFRRAVPGADADAAAAACAALAAAGAVLRHGNTVFLRPGEVAAALRRVLPPAAGAAEAARARLDGAEGRLAELDGARAGAAAGARRRARLANLAFVAGLSAQWALLLRLTYWELSWDVIEPIGYFLSSASTVLAALWFLRAGREFNSGSFGERAASKYERRALAAAGYDAAEHARLRGEVERLRDALAVAAPPAEAPAAEAPAAGDPSETSQR
jgi:hypothetical protein